jgi:hypothetical protein
VLRSTRRTIVSVENYNGSVVGAVNIGNKLNTDTLLAALTNINWSRADGVAREDYDLFERDKWPKEDLNFTPWSSVIWAQGEEAGGMLPEERSALKSFLSAGNIYDKSNLIIAGQEISRVHDVALTASNGMVADQEFVRTYLRAMNIRNTNPANYDGRRIRGRQITPGLYEQLMSTGYAGDTPPLPSVVRTTSGQGIAQPSHVYVDETQPTATTDSAAGVASAAQNGNVVFYAFDWRHAGRWSPQPSSMGARDLLLGALDFENQFSSILPVKLVDFKAYQSGDHAVSVDWLTAQEVDVAGLEIERATVNQTEAGQVVGTFNLIDRKSPAGSATRGASYQVVDRGVEVGSEYVYRLVSVNLEGIRTIEKSAQVKVTGNGTATYTLAVAPNPVRTTARIEYKVAGNEQVRLVLYDATGRQVMVVSDVMTNGNGVSDLNVSNLASGTYTLRMETAGGTVMTQKVTVAK